MRRLLACFMLAWAVAGCASVQPAATLLLDATPRVAVISAFDAELALLRAQTRNARSHRVNGVEFTTGELEGRPVVP